MSQPLVQPPATQTPTANIISVAEIPSSDPNRLGKSDMVITYQVGNHVFQTKIPAEGATHDLEIAAIRSDYQKKKLLIGSSQITLQ